MLQITFFAAELFAFESGSINIKLPANAMFVDSDKEVNISLSGKLYQDFLITPWNKDIKLYKEDNVIDLLSMILLSYQKKDIKILKSLYIKETQAKFKDIPKALKEKRLNFYADVKSANLKYIINH